MNQIPSDFQGYLWSKDVKSLDLKKDNKYIINQLLNYGDMTAIKLLFKLYTKNEIINIFLKYPSKIYTKSTLNFVKNYLLGLSANLIQDEKYLNSSPRNI